jgi:hypothetical protein
MLVTHTSVGPVRVAVPAVQHTQWQSRPVIVRGRTRWSLVHCPNSNMRQSATLSHHQHAASETLRMPKS